MRQSLMIWQASIIHLVWGIALLADDRASWTTAIHSISIFITYKWAEPLVMIVASILSIASMYKWHRSFKGLIALMPQQFLMMFSAWGAVQASVSSQFADGVIRPFWFIFADQIPYVIIMILHTLAILEEYFGETWKAIGLQSHR